MQIIFNGISTLKFFASWMLFLTPNQQYRSTESENHESQNNTNSHICKAHARSQLSQLNKTH